MALERFQRLQVLLRPGFRILDVGAGSGEFLYVLRAMGYEVSGFEPNEGYARYAAEVLGLPVRQGFWQDAAVAAESQDVVTLCHTLEHLENPFEVMRHARPWLRPQGLLWVEVPNVEAVCQQPHSQFHHGHLYHFNLATLEMMARRAGYAVVGDAVSSDGGNITVIVRRSETALASSVEIPGNYEKVSAILRQHTTWRHAFSRHPYVRPLRKLAARLEEQRKVRRHRSATEMLDALVSDARGRWGVQPPGSHRAA